MGKHRNDFSGRTYNDGKGGGYKNPTGPKWAPGQSGNPSGKKGSKRPRPLDELAGQLWEILERPAGTMDGDVMTVLAGMMTTLCQKGLQDPKIALRVLEYITDLERVRGAAPAEPETDPEALSEPEDELLEAALDRRADQRERLRGAGQGAHDLPPADPDQSEEEMGDD